MTEKTSAPQLTAETPAAPKPKRFISLRWRFTLPLFIVVLLAAMGGAYLLARSLGGGLAAVQDTTLLETSRAVAQRAVDLYNRQRQEAQRIAFTEGVVEGIEGQQAEGLHSILEGLARVADLDGVIVTDASGVEVLGLQRVPGEDDYALSTGTDLGEQAIIRDVLDAGFVGATALMRTNEGLMLFTAVPASAEDRVTGVVLVGWRLDAVLDALQGGAPAEVAFYGADGRLLQTTFAAPDLEALSLAREVFNQALTSVQQVPLQAMQIGGVPYQSAYFPFNFGPQALGVIGTLLPDAVPYATENGRQAVAALASVLTGVVVSAAFIAMTRVATRANRLKAAAQALAAGERATRTGMQAVDEISAVGQALDEYADYVQTREDKLRIMLRRQRREVTHITAVLEALPDGVIVQDMDGRVLLMNEHAKRLLGSQRVFRSARLDELASVVTQVMGPALAPGLYMLGEPQRIGLDDRMLSAQAAAVMSATQHRLGTVLLLRDVTDMVRQERAREELLGRLMEEIQQPLAGLGRAGARSRTDLVNAFAREITRQAVALQKMIVDLRELNDVSVAAIQRSQQPIRVETLLWGVANEWRQVAQANGLTMHIIIEQKRLFVLGDERRLRWAMGNVVDNAIKYTPSGGALTLEIQESADGMARLRVRDNGVGIARDELQFVFTRFYRGTPTAQDGTVIRVPGMGQGLSAARQIFEAHGGAVRIKSTPGVGTAVYMSLPLTSGEAYQLPYLEEVDMEGETVLLDHSIPHEIRIE